MKRVKKILALLTVMATLLLLCACENQSAIDTDSSKKATTTANGSTASISTESTTDNIHTHSYTAVVTEPTCAEKGYTIYTCDCGDRYIADYIETLDHTYVDNICEKCSAKKPAKTLSTPFSLVPKTSSLIEFLLALAKIATLLYRILTMICL